MGPGQCDEKCNSFRGRGVSGKPRYEEKKNASGWLWVALPAPSPYLEQFTPFSFIEFIIFASPPPYIYGIDIQYQFQIKMRSHRLRIKKQVHIVHMFGKPALHFFFDV